MNLFRWFGGSRRPPDHERWRQLLDQAYEHIHADQFHEALDLLNPAFQDQLNYSDRDTKQIRLVTESAVGECQFQLGKSDLALESTKRALQQAEILQDRNMKQALLGNLLEIHRWRGEKKPASDIADSLSSHHDSLGDSYQAERYRKLAELIRKEEPLLRVVVNLDGRRMELDEILAGQEGKVQFVYARNRLTIRSAERETNRGEEKAHRGEFERALECFDRAVQLDPYAPEPHYQAGHVLVYLAQYAGACVRFRKVEERAPGWFAVRSALWLVGEILAGRLAPEVYRNWHLIAEGPLPVAEKLHLVEQTIQIAPKLPHLYYLRGKLLRERGLAIPAEKALREGLLHAEEPNIVTPLCVELATITDDPREKRYLLRRAIEDNGDLVSVARARILLAFA